MYNKKQVTVIGSGFAGLSAASFLAKGGAKVRLLEKNSSIGGRARAFQEKGFFFDMGPSWYWMPEVFERYYQQFGHTTSDFYELKRLDPSYRVFFAKNEVVDIPAKKAELLQLFESIEKGSAKKLEQFLKEAAYKYKVGVEEFVYKPGLSWLEFADLRVMKSAFKLHLLTSIHTYIRKYFKNPSLIQLLEFPVLFLGAVPKKIPALYSMMNYADMELGTWYPMGGMHKIVQAFEQIAIEQGVEIKTSCEVDRFSIENGILRSVHCGDQRFATDFLVAGADYRHVDQVLTEEKYRNYSSAYWEKRVMAPSCLLYYVGLSKPVEGLLHHNLFFDEDFAKHANEIYESPQWPSKPLFYLSCPSKTDPSVAPAGHENLFMLIPVAPGLQDNEQIREAYFDLICERIHSHLGVSIKDLIVYKKSYAPSNFIQDYHAHKGNAYGLANTLRQTAVLKPSIRSKKVKNLFFTGQLTVPGPGVPPSIISGEVVSKLVLNACK